MANRMNDEAYTAFIGSTSRTPLELGQYSLARMCVELEFTPTTATIRPKYLELVRLMNDSK